MSQLWNSSAPMSTFTCVVSSQISSNRQSSKRAESHVGATIPSNVCTNSQPWKTIAPSLEDNPEPSRQAYLPQRNTWGPSLMSAKENTDSAFGIVLVNL